MSDVSLVKEYVGWLGAQQVTGAKVESDGQGNRVTFTSEAAVGVVEVYELEMDVVAMTVMAKASEDPTFFLHFELDDLDRAKEQFASFAGALSSAERGKTLRVLLSCTSALTTSFFAKKLSYGAEVMSFDMDFRATPFAKIYEEGIQSDVILLAPQVAFHEREVAQAFPTKFVKAVPPEHFGSYDVGAVLSYLRDEQVKWRERRAERERLDAREQVRSRARVLTVGVFAAMGDLRLAGRIYQGGAVVQEEVTVVPRTAENYAGLASLVHDVLATMQARFGACDAAAIALPGVIKDGVWRVEGPGGLVRVDFAREAASRGDLVPLVVNNVNAAALGYSRTHEGCRDLAFVSHPMGIVAGGMGLVSDGRLQAGSHGAAGEVKYVTLETNEHAGRTQGMAFDPERMLDMVSLDVRLAVVALDPPVVCVRCPLTPDMGELADRVAAHVPREDLPELRFVTEDEMTEYTMVGQMLMALDAFEEQAL